MDIGIRAFVPKPILKRYFLKLLEMYWAWKNIRRSKGGCFGNA
jgi:hypothetical protein